MKLYGWQEECLGTWAANDYRGIVSAVTGSGKTMLALAGAERLMTAYPNLRIRIVAPTIALANQWRQAVQRFPGLSDNRPGFYGDGIRDEDGFTIDAPIMSQSIQRERRQHGITIRTVLRLMDTSHKISEFETIYVFRDIDENEKSRFNYLHSIELGKKGYTREKFEEVNETFGVYVLQSNAAKSAEEIFSGYKSAGASKYSIGICRHYQRRTGPCLN